MYTVTVDTDNTIKTVTCPDELSLDIAKEIINCDIVEVVRPMNLPRKFVMLIDEEGKLRPNCINPICSHLYGYEKHGDPIVGKALFVKSAIVDGEPDFVWLDKEDVDELIKILMESILEVLI